MGRTIPFLVKLQEMGRLTATSVSHTADSSGDRLDRITTDADPMKPVWDHSVRQGASVTEDLLGNFRLDKSTEAAVECGAVGWMNRAFVAADSRCPWIRLGARFRVAFEALVGVQPRVALTR